MSGMKDAAVEGFTPEQQFFVSFGQIWCDNARPEVLRLRAQVDPHSPDEFRVNGVLSNMPEFQKAFSCKPGLADGEPEALPGVVTLFSGVSP